MLALLPAQSMYAAHCLASSRCSVNSGQKNTCKGSGSGLQAPDSPPASPAMPSLGTARFVSRKELVGGLADACGDLSPQGPFALSRSCIRSSQATGREHLPVPDAQLGPAAGATRRHRRPLSGQRSGLLQPCRWVCPDCSFPPARALPPRTTGLSGSPLLVGAGAGGPAGIRGGRGFGSTAY